MNKLIGMLVAFVGVFAGVADIVHSPYAAFIANVNAGANFSNGPQIDANGGIWSYGYRYPTLSTNLIPFSSESLYKRANSEMYGLSKYPLNTQGGFYPYVIINATANPVSDAGSNPRRAVQPGVEFVVQPGMRYEDNRGTYGIAVIRFTAPRAGRYSVTAICEPLATGGSPTSFHILSNGVLLEQCDVEHPKNGTVTPRTLAVSDLLLGSGEYVELVTGPGISTPTDASCDSASVKIEIVEAEGPCYSLGDDMAANILAGNTDNPFCTGRWTAGRYTRKPADPYPGKDGVAALKWGFNRDTYHVGYSKDGTTNRSQLYCCVNTNDAIRAVMGGAAQMDPHEIFVLPMVDENACFRFTTPEDGTWRMTAQVRNLQNKDGNADNAGIVVSLLAGGHRLDHVQLPTVGLQETRTFSGVASRLKAGSFIDLTVDSRGNYASDTTGVKFLVEKVADSECPYADGGVAFNTEMAKKANATNPFTDANGIMWKVGQSSGPRGAFSLLPYYLERVTGYLAGWTPSSSAVLPRLQANFNATNLFGIGSVTDGDLVLFGNEFYLHPNGAQHGILRFIAPSTGVYRVNSTFRDVSRGNNGMTDPGVNCYLRANEQIAAAGFACIAKDGGGAESARQVAFLDAEKFYLAAGEPIDFSVGTVRGANADATAVSCRVTPDGTFEESFANVDFTTGTTTSFTGRGRLGWANPRWNALDIGSGVSAARLYLRNADNERTATTVVISNGTSLVASSVASETALLAKGVVSANATDESTFVVGGLKANEPYRLCLYGGVQGTGTARAVFTVDGKTETATSYWYRTDAPEVAIIDATADANGTISGTFKSNSDAPVAFFGLQVAGSFNLAPTGLMILIK